MILTEYVFGDKVFFVVVVIASVIMPVRVFFVCC
jgi:hypothetical protein